MNGYEKVDPETMSDDELREFVGGVVRRRDEVRAAVVELQRSMLSEAEGLDALGEMRLVMCGVELRLARLTHLWVELKGVNEVVQAVADWGRRTGRMDVWGEVRAALRGESGPRSLLAELPEGLAHWTPDEVAECLPVSGSTYKKLWSLLSELERAGDAVPLGGDGTGGTVEHPPEIDAYPSGRMGALWAAGRFSMDEQRDILRAWDLEEEARNA